MLGGRHVFGAVIILFVSVIIRADLYIQRTHHTDSYTKNNNLVPAVNSTSVVWLGKDRARIDISTDTSIIIMLDKNVLYVVCAKTKTYVKEPIDPGKEIPYTAMEDDGDMTVVEYSRPAATMNVSLSGAHARQKKKIGNWNCRQYNLSVSSNGVRAQSILWVTNDVNIDYAFYNKITNVYLKKISGISDACKEIDKIKGLPVLITTITHGMGATVKSSDEIIRIEEKEPFPDAYNIPAGFIRTGK